MERILISACLIGDNTRYDGKNNLHPLVNELHKYFDLIPFCPEVEGGLKIPREPSEIVNDKVLSKSGRDVTFNFERGADLGTNIILALGIRFAVLKDGSPSCGNKEIYDGTFTDTKIKGRGVFAKALSYMGVEVFTENEIQTLLDKFGKKDQ